MHDSLSLASRLRLALSSILLSLMLSLLLLTRATNLLDNDFATLSRGSLIPGRLI